MTIIRWISFAMALSIANSINRAVSEHNYDMVNENTLFLFFVFFIHACTTVFELRRAKKGVFKNIANIKLSAEKEASEIVSKASDEANKLLLLSEKSCEKSKSDLNDLIRSVELELQQRKQEVEDLKLSVIEMNSAITEHYAMIPIDYSLTSSKVKNELSVLRHRYIDFVKSLDSVSIFSDDTKKRINDNKRQLLRAFDAESSLILSSLTVKNVDSSREKLSKCFSALNKLYLVDGVALEIALLKMKMEELDLLYTHEKLLENEREEQKEIRSQMLEEAKVLREIEEAKKKIEKEEKQFKSEISKLMSYLQKSSDIEKQLYLDKISELEEKLRLVEKDKSDALHREQSTRAGYVYVISNIGSFGENVFKIGMTRRLEPMDRVRELGDASVPFEFDVHAMIFSDDAPSLEAILHKTFSEYQVNKINSRKEFFNVSIEEIERVVLNHHNATVSFTKVAAAEQYRQSLAMSSKVSIT